MKRYIHCSEASERFQAKQQAKLSNRAKKQQRLEYVRSIRDGVKSALQNRIKSDLFDNSKIRGIIKKYIDDNMTYYNEYYQSRQNSYKQFYDIKTFDEWFSRFRDNIGAFCLISPENEYIKITVDILGINEVENLGLQWLADIETGGDGKLAGVYISKMPARMKRKMEEYGEIIATYIEDLGFEVLAPAKITSHGFVYYVTNDTYESLI